jgi:pyruvate dehydrogenase E2 component (dihydrolipoamide acetyltransferase)
LIPAAPSVRLLARELGVDLRQVSGSGPRGRISKADVKAWVKTRLQAAPSAPVGAVALAVPDLPDFSQWGAIHSEKLTPVRRATAAQMHRAWSQIPHVTQFDQADITEAETFRKAWGKKVEAAGGKLTVTAILLKLCGLALKRFPKFNASLDLKNDQIIYKDYIHVGVAVDTPRGLLVPVIRDVDRKGVTGLSVELGELARKARDRKLSAEDLQGGGFSISNLGGLGTTYFTPIVNWPEVAILGVGRAQTQPIWREGQFVPRQIMPLSLSYDHRLIDGADAARFLRFLAEALESPLMLLMEGDL